MTRKDFIKLLNKGVITHTGFVDSNGDIKTEEDLDVLASQLITQTGITDGDPKGEKLQGWIDEHYPDTESGPEPPTLTAPTIEVAEITGNPTTVKIIANDYAGANVTLSGITDNGADIKFSTTKTSLGNEELAIKVLKNKTVYMSIYTRPGNPNGTLTLKLVDDLGKELVTKEGVQFNVPFAGEP